MADRPYQQKEQDYSYHIPDRPPAQVPMPFFQLVIWCIVRQFCGTGTVDMETVWIDATGRFGRTYSKTIPLEGQARSKAMTSKPVPRFGGSGFCFI